MNASCCTWDVFLTAVSSLVLKREGRLRLRVLLNIPLGPRVSEQHKASAPACLSALLRCAWLQARHFSGTCCSCAQHMEHCSSSTPFPPVLPTAHSWDSPAFTQPRTEPTQPRAALVSPLLHTVLPMASSGLQQAPTPLPCSTAHPIPTCLLCPAQLHHVPAHTETLPRALGLVPFSCHPR